MDEDATPKVDFSTPVLVLEFIFAGILIEAALVSAFLSAAPAGTIDILLRAGSALFWLAIAGAYIFGLIADSVILIPVRRYLESRGRSRVVRRHYQGLASRAFRLQRLGVTPAVLANASHSRLDASRIVEIIHPFVGRHDAPARREIQFQRRLYRMARGAILPSILWCLLSWCYVAMLLWPTALVTLPLPLRNIVSVFILAVAATLMSVGATYATLIRCELMASHACRAFFDLEPPAPTPNDVSVDTLENIASV